MLALMAWSGTTIGDCVLDLLVALLPFDEEDIARGLWRLAVMTLVVGSVGKLATDGL